MSTTTIQDWPQMTAPSFLGAAYDGTDVYELFDAASDDGTSRVAIYHRQSNGLWPCREVAYDKCDADEKTRAELRAHFLSVMEGWLDRASSVIDHRTDKSIPLPPCKGQKLYAQATLPKSSSSGIPLRRYTKHNKRRDITKTESDAFNAVVKSLMSSFPFDDEGLGGWIVQTDFGPLRIHQHYSPHRLCYVINTRFCGTREDLARAVERFGENEVNRFSGKWNILQVEGNNALDILKMRLKAVNAHP